MGGVSSIRNGVGPRGKSQERFVGQLLGFRWSSTRMTTAESVPTLTVYKGRAAAWQRRPARCSSDGVTERVHYFGVLELQPSL